ncbi:retron-type reverse transcriptase [Pedobacter metabolipauper]|uniref:RNA-directed DNA polymerase n=1 Tax=Pedobacter metabolipauper TaxID=425513 RepID=A0A4R6STT1_9SPHI|nr:retron-type reverse transcriptase [Pedobacter metabolipauper]
MTYYIEFASPHPFTNLKDPLKQITQEQRQEVASKFHACASQQEFYQILVHLVSLLDINDLGQTYCCQILSQFEIGEDSPTYSNFSIKKRSGRYRHISAPSEELMLIHRLINFLLSCVFQGHQCSHGFKKGSSVVSNAVVHVGKKYVFNIDLKDFFPSIDSEMVKEALMRPPFNLSGERKSIAEHLSGLCTMRAPLKKGIRNSSRKFILPQGAPTSPLLSNAVCQNLDNLLESLAKANQLVYTRYADDITFSGNNNVFEEGSAFLIELVRIISEQGFQINESKTRLLGKSARQEVTGIVVNEKTNVKREYLKPLRMYIYYWEKYGYHEAEIKFFNDRSLISDKEMESTLHSTLDGRLNYMKMVTGENHPTYLKLSKRFKKLANKRFAEKKQKSSSTHKGDFSEHRPKDLARFLRFFQDSDGLKYLTHDFDMVDAVFDYDRIMMYAVRDFFRGVKENYITKQLYARVYQFAFEEEPNWWKYEDGKRIEINIGWSSKQIKEWVRLNPGTHPIRSKLIRDNLIRPFKESIQFRPPALRNRIESTVREKFGEDYDELQIDYSNLEAAEFYTDVELVLSGVRHLLDGILERIGISKTIHIAFSKQEVNGSLMKVLEITHVGSRCYKNALPKELLNGNFSDALKLFHGLCNWAVRASFADGDFEVDMLSDKEKLSQKRPVNKELISGFTHLLRFY